MSKELIDHLRSFPFAMTHEAADLIEAQQKRIDDLESEIDRKMSAASYVIEQLAASQAQIKVMREALENCRLLAARHRKEEWATHILRFCESGGSVANPLRQDDSALHERLKAERERCAKVIERLISGDGICADDGVWIHDCAEAIRAMEDQ